MTKHLQKFSVLLADKIADFIGSWTFIIIQSSILTLWIIFNVDHLFNFDPYPFILLNLFLSFEAAYATPLILMSANRSAERDRKHAMKDFKLDQEAHDIIIDVKQILEDLQEEIKFDKKALSDHHILKSDHKKIENELAEIKELLKTLNLDR
jgi:uncharacterized membrane protein